MGLVSDPNSEYYRGYLAQLTKWPNSRYITYYKEHLFLCGFEDNPRMVRWSMAFPGHRIFAETGFTYVGGSQGEDLVGFIEYGEQLLVAEINNIWRLSFVSIDDFAVPHWEPCSFPGLAVSAPRQQ